MEAIALYKALESHGIDFFSGVPDSLLASFCKAVCEGEASHVAAPNEGAALSLCAGYTLSTGKIGCVYLQNSGIGNLYNPLCALTHPAVYGIPALLVIGWRGQPGKKPDEPQHLHQGKITLETLKILDIPYEILPAETTGEALQGMLKALFQQLAAGKTAALVVEEGALGGEKNGVLHNSATLSREGALGVVLDHAGDSAIIATTGKIARELYEWRERRGEGHERDFLCVGGMGHALSVALGVALGKPARQVLCLDGDGALLMQQGALSMVGTIKPKNLLHVVLNNGVHDTVGGMPHAAPAADYTAIAAACGYINAQRVTDAKALKAALSCPKEGLSFLEILVKPGARSDLGRPKESPQASKIDFCKFLEVPR